MPFFSRPKEKSLKLLFPPPLCPPPLFSVDPAFCCELLHGDLPSFSSSTLSNGAPWVPQLLVEGPAAALPYPSRVSFCAGFVLAAADERVLHPFSPLFVAPPMPV